ncbi:MAG: phospholipase D-like domain-containing protein [Candidatus Melainabacteria bacterium]|nr:phospholipase D-like domain-containing protein [Candidatus Melainabacteria bacterium]
MKAVAFGNNTASVIVWLRDTPIDGCLGYSVRRINVATGKKEALKAYLPFPGQEKDGSGWTSRTTDEWPIQGFKWKDFTGKLGETYKYEVVPMVGTPDALKALESEAVITNETSRSMDCGEFIKACFNRGILSTQKLASMLPKLADGSPDPEKLIEELKKPDSQIRRMLAGDLPGFILSIFEDAKAEGGHVHSALYELADPQIVDYLLANIDVFSLILGEAGENNETNAPAQARLIEAGADLTLRPVKKSSISHNKLHVRKNKKGKAVAVLATSANSTFTGLSCQSNNAVSIASAELAGIVSEYWDALKADAESGEMMGQDFRAANRAKPKLVTLKDGTTVQAWFAPNTVENTKPKTKPGVPVDMGEVFDAIDGAKEGVYFLAFYPGFPSIISKINGMQFGRKDLFYRGAVSSPQALPKPFTPQVPNRFVRDAESGLMVPAGVSGDGINSVDVSGAFADLAGAAKVAAPVQIFHHDKKRPVIIAADSLETAVGKWQRELLKLPDAHSIIHDKIVVVDPFGDNPVVITGSHNLGFKASYSNDEALFIIRGNHRLAAAYLAHILNVYDHYRFRSMVRNDGGKFEASLEPTAAWQDRFFKPSYMSSKSRRELDYFISGAKRLEKAVA